MNANLLSLRRDIAEAKRKLNHPQSFSAQVIGCALKEIAATYGREEANKAIKELGLLKCGWKLESMKLTTTIKNAKGVAIAIANRPAPDSQIMLAEDDKFYVAAAPNKYKNGFLLKVVRRADQQRFNIAGFKASDIKKCNLDMDQLVKYATDYMAKFLTLDHAPLVKVDPRAFLAKLKVEKAPKHTQRWIVWNEDGTGTAILLVGYCPQTLPYYLGLTAELLKTFPDVDQGEIGCHHVTQSHYVKGFTLLLAKVKGPKREIPGYDERKSIDFNY